MPLKATGNDMDNTIHAISEKLGALQCHLDSESPITEKLGIPETQMANQQSLNDSRHNTLTNSLDVLRDQVQSFTTIPHSTCHPTIDMPFSHVPSHNLPPLTSHTPIPTSTSLNNPPPSSPSHFFQHTTGPYNFTHNTLTNYFLGQPSNTSINNIPAHNPPGNYLYCPEPDLSHIPFPIPIPHPNTIRSPHVEDNVTFEPQSIVSDSTRIKSEEEIKSTAWMKDFIKQF